MTSSIKNTFHAAESKLESLLGGTANESIKTRLKLMHAVCYGFVRRGKRLTIAGVVRKYEETRGDGPELAESTIRNKRIHGNPYMELYGAWEAVARDAAHHFENGRKRHTNGEILSHKETYAIEDISLRHRTNELINRVRSLQKERDILRSQFSGQSSVVIASNTVQPAVSDEEEQRLHLTQTESDAIKRFLESLDRGVLKKSADDGVKINNGPYIAESGFVTALQKVLRAADPIPF